ncbi:MAG: hypothetical protein ACOYMN_18840 [Roseimicrobium sp.]
MKRILWGLALLLGAAFAVWKFLGPASDEPMKPFAEAQQPQTRPAGPVLVASPTQLEAVIASAGEAKPTPFKRVEASPPPPPKIPAGYDVGKRQEPATQEAEMLALNLRHYGQRFGGNPVGTNAEIVKTLNGGNPQGARYLPQDTLRLNGQGELLDHYGTPYFFHQLSAQEMEVRSAGADKTLWTPDDIVVK